MQDLFMAQRSIGLKGAKPGGKGCARRQHGRIRRIAATALGIRHANDGARRAAGTLCGGSCNLRPVSGTKIQQ
jgi:hypothetical protein